MPEGARRDTGLEMDVRQEGRPRGTGRRDERMLNGVDGVVRAAEPAWRGGSVDKVQVPGYMYGREVGIKND